MRPDAEALEHLREALDAARRTQGRAVPRDALARLTRALPAGVGLTVDFDAAEQLGPPVVVLRPIARPPDPTFDGLSPREREVAGLVAAGLRNKDIAMALGIALGTVKDHVHRVLDKTGLDGRSAIAAAWARAEAP